MSDVTDQTTDESTGASTGWGILATGKIARSFAADLALVPGARLAAVGSRTAAGAAAFTATYGGTPYDSYQALLADPAVDVVYVASPHALHLEHASAALAAGKHVLCEKPLTLRTADNETLVARAAEAGLFLMEAMWTACHPVVRAVQDGLREGRFGTPRHLHAELGFRVDADPTDRLLDPALGAGALLDMGIYPLTIAHLLLGEAEQLVATGALSPSGIDLDVAIAGRSPGGALATMNASMTSWSSRAADLATDAGRLHLADFHHPTEATFTPYGDRGSNDVTDAAEAITIEGSEPVIGRGYGNEALEVQRCLRDGLLESPLVPHAQTLLLARQMDDVLEQLGVVYPA